MIKIVSGWTKQGGSTVAHINLCNLLNEKNIECELYGPHDWHLNKCKSKKINELIITSNDTLISHFININPPKNKKHIYSCHETNLAPVKDIENLYSINIIHYVSEFQKKWHNHQHPSIVIPNVISKLKKSPLKTNSAGIIGSIDRHKQTHISIKRALDDGYEKIYIFGLITDDLYFIDYILPLLKKHEIILMNHMDDKQKMYDMIDCVYHSSKLETFNYIKVECELTGVLYKGLQTCDPNSKYLTNDEIFTTWMSIIN